jgi:hypothetical protein
VYRINVRYVQIVSVLFARIRVYKDHMREELCVCCIRSSICVNIYTCLPGYFVKIRLCVPAFLNTAYSAWRHLLGELCVSFAHVHLIMCMFFYAFVSLCGCMHSCVHGCIQQCADCLGSCQVLFRSSGKQRLHAGAFWPLLDCTLSSYCDQNRSDDT